MANVANPERGEVDLHVKRADGEIEKTYVLKLSINAAVTLQKKLKKSMAEIVADLEKMDFDAIREIAFMLLQKHHRDEIKTPEAAGDVIDDAGGAEKFFAAFQALIKQNTPQGEGGGDGNPHTAQTSSTGVSTSTPVAPA